MKLHESITDDFKAWIAKQHVFFVGTAPLSGDGHVNLSPKGYDALRIIDDKTICYMDMAGSGNETSAHIAEDGNGRVTFMFCGFEGGPRILRLYGRGEVMLPDHPKWNEYMSKHYQNVKLPGTRQIIVNHVERVQTSCGYAVPFMNYQEDRTTLCNFFDKKGEEGCEEYMRAQQRTSIDDLPTPQGKTFSQAEEGKSG